MALVCGEYLPSIQSVHYLMDALAILATVAKGCNHQQLMKTSSECTLRLVNRSWQHLQKVLSKVSLGWPG